MIKSVPNRQLEKGMVVALPMGRTANILSDPKVGREFVHLFCADAQGHRYKTRVSVDDETLIHVPDPADVPEDLETEDIEEGQAALLTLTRVVVKAAEAWHRHARNGGNRSDFERGMMRAYASVIATAIDGNVTDVERKLAAGEM